MSVKDFSLQRSSKYLKSHPYFIYEYEAAYYMLETAESIDLFELSISVSIFNSCLQIFSIDRPEYWTRCSMVETRQFIRIYACLKQPAVLTSWASMLIWLNALILGR